MRHIIDVRNGGVRMKIIPFSEIKNELKEDCSFL